MLEDIAILTGGQVISEDLGIKLENVNLLIWFTKRVKVEEEIAQLLVDLEKSDIEADSSIKQQIDETTSDYDREKPQD